MNNNNVRLGVVIIDSKTPRGFRTRALYREKRHARAAINAGEINFSIFFFSLFAGLRKRRPIARPDTVSSELLRRLGELFCVFCHRTAFKGVL